MVINNVPKITDSMRVMLNEYAESTYKKIELDVNRLLTYTPGEFVKEFIYHNIYQSGKNNIVYDSDDNPLMSVFNFDPKERLRILNILNLKEHSPVINAIRVLPNSRVPLHLDLNKGDIGRENMIYSVVVSGGPNCTLHISNKTDGSIQFIIPGMSDFVMLPTLIAHGVQSAEVPYTLLQIQLDKSM